MAKQLELRYGTTSQLNNFKGGVGELTYDTQQKSVRVHDGSTDGGFELAKKSELTPQATETTAGKVKINNTLTSTSTDSALTAAQGKVLNDQAFGVGQSVIDVTSSRLANTTYTNPTNKVRVVMITVTGGGSSDVAYLFSDNVRCSKIENLAQSTEVELFCVIGAGKEYRLQTSGTAVITQWSEF